MATTRRDDDPEWMTRAQVADHLGVTLRTVARYIENGDLRAFKRGPRAVRIRRVDVDAMFKEMPPHPHDTDHG